MPYTFNNYINVTIFLWLEVVYTCTLVEGTYPLKYILNDIIE